MDEQYGVRMWNIPGRGDSADVGIEPRQMVGMDAAQRERLFWSSPTWALLPRIAADGHSGSVRTFQRGRVRCQVSEEWDGGDDADTTYVPDPFYRESTLCWEHSRELVPADTSQAPG